MSVIIVNWITRDYLVKCLKSVYDTIQNFPVEILVVDNGSTDNSQEIVHKDFPHVRLIENNENLGFAKANNQAIRLCKGKYVLLLNSDAMLTGNAAKQMVQIMEKHADVGIAGANLLHPGGQPQISHGPLPTLLSEIRSLFGFDKLIRRSRHTDPSFSFIDTGYVDGACLMARKTMLEQIGLLDEDFFMFSEEVDLCFRAFLAGWKVIHIPSAKVTHIGGGSTGTTPNRILRLYRGKLQYFAKHYGLDTQLRLFSIIRLTTHFKVFFYSILKWVSFGRIRKGEFWQSVVNGLDGLWA